MLPTDWLSTPLDAPPPTRRRPLDPPMCFEPHTAAVYPVTDLGATQAISVYFDRPPHRAEWRDRTTQLPPPPAPTAAYPVSWLTDLEAPRRPTPLVRLDLPGEPALLIQPIIAQLLGWLTPVTERSLPVRLLPVEQTWAIEPSLLSAACVDLGLDALSLTDLTSDATTSPALIAQTLTSPALIGEDLC
jgi:hypothetical protein